MSYNTKVAILHKLARLYGIQIAYYDVFHHRRKASEVALVEVLKALGAPMEDIHDTTDALRKHTQSLWSRVVEPVAISWNGAPIALEIRTPQELHQSRLVYHLCFENGTVNKQEYNYTDLATVNAADVEGKKYIVKKIMLPGHLPFGYHKLIMEMAGGKYETLIISAPEKSYKSEVTDKRWGIFLPLYSLNSAHSWGIGDYTDMEKMISWASKLGAKVAATLPLQPIFEQDNKNPCPYLPVSRLLWNEFFIDVNRIPELAECHEARLLVESLSFINELNDLRRLPLVNYQRLMNIKRRVLQLLASHLFNNISQRTQEMYKFIEAVPLISEYAQFRAVLDTQKGKWQNWPEKKKNGLIQEGDYLESDRQYHLYAQWVAHQQMHKIGEKARSDDIILYLDMPIGVHKSGFDTWKQPQEFVMDVSAGAPPDAVFTQGQNWDFPPLHPNNIREGKYEYVRRFLNHNLSHAHILRVDHVMGLHRIFCVPEGLETKDGVYLHYRADELYAIIALESHRNKSIVVGEDLGTVPYYVRPAMRKHGLKRMYVLHYELETDKNGTVNPVPRNVVASINTHDMPPFAAFWQDLDIEERFELGLITRSDMILEMEARQWMKKVLIDYMKQMGWLTASEGDTVAMLRSCLAFLSASQASMVLVNLEDLWQETVSQNVPGTNRESNWRHKARYGFDEFSKMTQVIELLKMINHLRK